MFNDSVIFSCCDYYDIICISVASYSWVGIGVQ